ncbi:MAG TPA: hypothetical protein VGL91_21495 [Acidobacteriota bacterium]|jgi:hypothetical protein
MKLADLGLFPPFTAIPIQTNSARRSFINRKNKQITYTVFIVTRRTSASLSDLAQFEFRPLVQLKG